MPILDVDHAKSIIVIKRSLGHGYAGLDNELYADPKTAMFFSDAKKGLAALLAGAEDAGSVTPHAWTPGGQYDNGPGHSSFP